MAETTFKALVTREIEHNNFTRSIELRNIDDLPPGNLLIRVQYSALNYKDALSARGHKGITRVYPHTPGIDAAGIVEHSDSSDFKAGDKVFVTGYDLGMNTSGGFGQYIRVPSGWAVKLPDNVSLERSMIYGTAGFTVGLAINEFQKHNITPDSGKILVTGATGAVGCLAITMLTDLGYHVVASTGKADRHNFLAWMGAKEIINRIDLLDKSGKPLLTKRWIGAIENVGGNTLSTVIRSTGNRGIVNCIGNVESDKLEISLYPFILRGVSLIGIDSAERQMDERLNIWFKIFNEWRIDDPYIFTKEVDLAGLDNEIELMLQGRQIGKVIINMEKAD